MINTKTAQIRIALLIAIFALIILPMVSTPVNATSAEFAGGSGTATDPYLIETKEQLNNVRNHLGAHYKMVADITFTEADFAVGGAFYNNGAGWLPIGTSSSAAFTGIFDGANHTIANMQITISKTDLWSSYTELYAGLFGYVKGTVKSTTIKNITLTAYDHYHKIYVGGIAGYCTGSIEDINITGHIEAQSGSEKVYVGGIIGLSNGSIARVHVDGSITGTTINNEVYAAGISGNSKSVTSSTNHASVIVKSRGSSYVGGISAYNGTIDACYNAGMVNGQCAGGIGGSNCAITQCYNKGSVIGTTYAGGIQGKGTNITDCFNIGNVTATTYAGGIVGLMGSSYVKNCYNLVEITGATYSGSIAGGNHGTVYAEDYILAGGTISNCYYPSSHTRGVGRGTGSATAKSLTDLKKQSTFVNFDFTTTWTISGNSNYLFPELKNNSLIINVESFILTSLPRKQTYLEGKELLNLSGAKGRIQYESGLSDTIDITENMVSGFDNSIVGTQSLTVSFGGKKATFSIEITPKKLTAISLNTPPKQTAYTEGTPQLDLSGATLLLSYNNNTTEIINITPNMISDFDCSTLGNQAITVSYGELSTSFNITIIQKLVDSISILSYPSKLTYICRADEIDVTGGMLYVVYNNGTSDQIPITNSMVADFDNSNLGPQTITLSYGGKTTAFNIQFVENYRDFNGGIGTEDNPFVIQTITHLNNISKYPSSHYIIANDIAFDPQSEAFPTGWKPFAFKGSLDGQGYKITGIKITVSNTSEYQWYDPGLFSSNSGTIENLTVYNMRISVSNRGDKYGGFICAVNTGEIINCHSTNCIIALQNTYHFFGGIAGNNSGSIQNCTSNNSINWGANGGRIGGITANNTGSINNCTNNGAITNLGAYTPISGGISALNSGNIISSNNLSPIVTKSMSSQKSGYSGGIVGQMTKGTISQCYNLGAITAEATEYKASAYSGGIVAYISGGNILDCYNTGDIYGETNSSSASCYVGGIIGYNNSIGTLKNCYSVGATSGRAASSNLYVGYVCGYNASNTIENFYYLGVKDNGAGYGDSSAMQGLNASQMKNQESFSGYDFQLIWEFREKNAYGYPTLINNEHFEFDYSLSFAECKNGEIIGTCNNIQQSSDQNIYFKLLKDAELNLSLTNDLCIDLNGYTLTGTITTNSYTLYGMDSTTDNYTCENIGYFNCVDENGEALVPVAHFKSDITGSAKRYMAIKDENGYSFHRFYLGITHMNMKPTITGIGYKAVFYGDDMVKAQLDEISAFGYTLQLGNYSPKTACKGRDSFVSGKTITLRINNFDVEEYGETPLYASVMLQLSDGTVIETEAVSITMRSMLETINARYTAFTAAQLSAIKTMIEKYAIIKEWDTKNLYA